MSTKQIEDMNIYTAEEIKQMKGIFSTLLHSWGGDSPVEAVWTANELMEFFLKSRNITLLDEDTSNYEKFIYQIEQVELQDDGCGNRTPFIQEYECRCG